MTAPIRRVDIEDADSVASLIRRAFGEVATQFGITSRNAPTHPSNCAPEWIQRDISKGITYYAVFVATDMIGCVGIVPDASGFMSFKHLAVHPDYQQGGVGTRLVNYAVELAARRSAAELRIGIVAEHRALGDWYRRRGFVYAECVRFPHLPFEVQYLTHDPSSPR